jgi:Integrase core domain
VCDALIAALKRYGIPDAILTDGKVFTARFGAGPGPVAFDRLCRDHGIRHLLTAPYSPNTTGKVERFHKTMRREFVNLNTFATVDEAQAGLDAWVEEYNTERDHQSLGDRPPVERFRLAGAGPELEIIDSAVEPPPPDQPLPPAITRRVGVNGCISLAAHRYLAARWLAGEVVEVIVDAGLVEIRHRGVLIASHAQRHPPARTISNSAARTVGWVIFSRCGHSPFTWPKRVSIHA